jgi:hypothetical protein
MFLTLPRGKWQIQWLIKETTSNPYKFLVRPLTVHFSHKNGITSRDLVPLKLHDYVWLPALFRKGFRLRSLLKYF